MATRRIEDSTIEGGRAIPFARMCGSKLGDTASCSSFLWRPKNRTLKRTAHLAKSSREGCQIRENVIATPEQGSRILRSIIQMPERKRSPMAQGSTERCWKVPQSHQLEMISCDSTTQDYELKCMAPKHHHSKLKTSVLLVVLQDPWAVSFIAVDIPSVCQVPFRLISGEMKYFGGISHDPNRLHSYYHQQSQRQN